MSPVWLMLPLAIVVSVIVAWPWLRRRLPAEQRRRAANIAAYRTRLAEIDAEQQGGALDAPTAQALRDEAGVRLLADEPDAAEKSRHSPTRYRVAGVVLSVVPVLIAIGWYAQDGSWRTAQAIQTGSAASDNGQEQQVQAMVAELRADLQQHPDNAERWAMLGRSEMVLENYSAAARAYDHANRESANGNADWLVAQGLADAMAHGRNLQGTPTKLFHAALKVAPDNARALWYAGVAAAQAGDDNRARKLWGILAAQPNVPDNVRSALQHQMAQLGAPAPPASTAEPTSASAGPAAHALVLDVQVQVAADLKHQLPAGATLFVYARRPGGPAMPLAVRRIKAPQFPVNVKLADSDAPMAGAKLGAQAQLEVVARLSKSGMAKPASGDLQGSIRIDTQQLAGPVTVRIDHALP